MLALVLLVGLGLRAAYLAERVREPDFAYPNLDGAFHDYWARALVSGDWSPPKHFADPEIARRPFFRPPAYPYFLALVYQLAGPGYLVPRVVQMALGLVNCLLAYRLGRRIFGPATGLVAAGLMATYWGFIYFEGELLAPVLLVFVALLLLNVLARWPERVTVRNTLAAGGLLGLLALGQPTALVLGPVIMAWGAWVAWHTEKRRRLIPVLVVLPLGTLAAIAPATIRNYRVAHDFVLITANGGVNLYIGNNPRADGVTADIPLLPELAALTGWTCFDEPAIQRGVEKLAGRPLKSSDVSRFFTRQALAFIRAEPRAALKLAGKKALLFWGPAEISNNKVDHYDRQASRVLRFLPRFSLVLALGLAGVLMLAVTRFVPRLDPWEAPPSHAGRAGRARGPVVVLLVLVAAAYFASYLPFFVAGRYRVPLVPIVLLFAAAALCGAAHLVRVRRWSHLLLWAAAVGGLLLLTTRPLVAYEPDRGLWHFDRGDAFRKQGRLDEAIAEFQRAAALRPDARAHNNLGGAYFEQHRYEEALAEFRTALALRPGYVEPRANLVTTLIRLGRADEAVPDLQELVRLRPDDRDSQYNLGTLLLGQGRPEAALEPLQAAVRIDPAYGPGWLNLAGALARVERFDAAVAAYETLVRLDPRQVQGRYELAVILSQQDRIEEAVAQLEQVLSIQPGHGPARRLLHELRP